jgi:exosortase/archaeosortase family protein
MKNMTETSKPDAFEMSREKKCGVILIVPFSACFPPWKTYPVRRMAKAPIAVWYDGKSPIFKYALKFGALMLLFYALSETPYCERVFWPANLRANAWVANGILRGLQQHTYVASDTIQAGNYAFVIKRGCDATEPVCLLMAAVVAFSAPFGRKLIGILAGTLLLLALNQLRVVALFFVGRDHPSLYHTLHLTVFPAVFIILAMILWVAWVEWTVGRDRFKTNASDAKT